MKMIVVLTLAASSFAASNAHAAEKWVAIAAAEWRDGGGDRMLPQVIQESGARSLRPPIARSVSVGQMAGSAGAVRGAGLMAASTSPSAVRATKRDSVRARRPSAQ